MLAPLPARRRADETRARILEAAAERFAADGYHGTSYGALIDASGLSKGAFYHHFRSKQELALAVYDTKQQATRDALDRAVAAVDSPFERLVTALRTRAALFAADRTLQCLPRLATDLAKVSGLEPQVALGHRVPIEWFRGMLEAARSAGEIREDVDLEAVARVLFSTLVGVGELSERESGGADHVARTEEVIAVLLGSLRTTAKNPRPAPARGGRATASTKAGKR